MKKVLKCTTLTVGATVGVGFVSGLEWRMFVGDNIHLFAIVFALANCAIACTAAKYRADTTQKLCVCLFGKFAPMFCAILTLCNVVTCIALLSAASEVLNGIVPQASKLVCAVAVCLSATVLAHADNDKCAVLTAIITLCAMGCMFIPAALSQTPPLKQEVHPLLTVVYALFGATMLSGITTKIAWINTVKQNVWYSLLSAAILAAMLYLPQKFGCLADITAFPSALLPLMFGTYLLSASTSVYANTIAPLVELTQLTNDKSLSCYVLFAFTVALSLFGVHHVMKFAYVSVAVVGSLLLVTIALKACIKVRNARKPTFYTKNRVL